MIVRYTTESGSVYTIDHDRKTWRRIRGDGAAEIRTDDGTFSTIDTGDGILMVMEPLVEGTIARIIHSTPVVKEEVLDDTQLPVNRSAADEPDSV